MKKSITQTNIEEIIRSILEENLPITKNNFNKILQKDYKIDINENKKVINKVFNDVTKIKLSYSQRSKKIERITEALEQLITNKKLDFDKKTKIVLLTRHNADIIEKLIKEDDDYYSFYDLVFRSFSKEEIKNNTNKALFAVVRQIDSDNRTNVWRYEHKNEFNNVIAYMTNPQNNFWKKLKQGEEGLPDLLSDDKVGTTFVKSLSSKICKYLSEEMYEADNYYINDRVIRHALLFYLDYYLDPKTKNDLNNDKEINEFLKSSNTLDNDKNFTYEKLFKLLSLLHDARDKKHNDGEINKSELDHIIWYCYKSFNTY